MRRRGEEGAGSAMLDGEVRAAEARDLAGVLELYRDLHPEVHRFYEACGFRAGEKTGFLARPGDSRARAPGGGLR
ncbi:hypothetical protein [Sorangium sp. So ce542]|uniref:hypothetical protein n=1 Tax=Sorangium sp. So ce542 TaxID=3133316 RepID=UPI003F613E4E